MSERIKNIIRPEGNCLTEKQLFNYAKGLLKGDALRSVEEHLAGCQFCSDALDGILESNDIGKQQQVVTELKKNFGVRKNKTIPLRTILTVAASVCLVISTIWFIQYSSRKSSDEIFAEQFKPYPAPPQTNLPLLTETTPETSGAASGEINTVSGTDAGTQSADKLEEQKPDATADEQMPVENSITSPLPPAPEAPDEDRTVQTFAFDSISKKSDVPNTAAGSTTRSENAKQKDEWAATDKEKDIETLPTTSATAGNSFTLSNSLEEYKNGDYLSAAQSFDDVLADDPNNTEALFYGGVSYLALGETEKAIDYLQKISVSNKDYYEAALWYLSLSYIKIDNTKKAENLLQKIVKMMGSYKEQAEEMLKKIK